MRVIIAALATAAAVAAALLALAAFNLHVFIETHRDELVARGEHALGRAVRIGDGRVDIEDRSGTTPRRLSAASVRLRASELRLGGDTRVRLDAALFPGSVRPDSHVELQITRLGMQDRAATPFTLHLDVHDADL